MIRRIDEHQSLHLTVTLNSKALIREKVDHWGFSLPVPMPVLRNVPTDGLESLGSFDPERGPSQLCSFQQIVSDANDETRRNGFVLRSINQADGNLFHSTMSSAFFCLASSSKISFSPADSFASTT